MNPMNRSVAVVAVLLLAFLAAGATAQPDEEHSETLAPHQGQCPVVAVLTYPPYVAVRPDCLLAR